MVESIGVLLAADLHNELVLRTGKTDGVTYIIENVVRDFLDRTKYDDELWSEDYIKKLEEIESDEFRIKYGNSTKGYFWQNLLLPNGTKLRMKYKGRFYYAEIAHEKLMYEGMEYSPSEFASIVANHTSRNAWRDIEACFPGETKFQLASILRRQAMESEND